VAYCRLRNRTKYSDRVAECLYYLVSEAGLTRQRTYRLGIGKSNVNASMNYVLSEGGTPLFTRLIILPYLKLSWPININYLLRTVPQNNRENP
jgi:hypothetical protein